MLAMLLVGLRSCGSIVTGSGVICTWLLRDHDLSLLSQAPHM